MKKQLLILFVISFTNVSYASFPILEKNQQQCAKYTVVDVVSDSEDYIYTFIGFIVGFLSVFLLFIPLLLLFSPNKSLRKGIFFGFLTMLFLIVLLLTIFLSSAGGLVIM